MNTNTAVTGILVTGKSAERFPLARRAVVAWQRQLFASQHSLLVINDHPELSLFNGTAPQGIREIRLSQRYTLGELRNIGIDEAKTDYLVQWDDDDYSHPSRLMWQIEHTQQGRASIFQYEIHCDLTGTIDASFVNNGRSIRTGGFPGTMMWPRKSGCRFRAIGKREDTEFVLALNKACVCDVLPNDPVLYCRCYHGNNTWSQEHVMTPKAGSRKLSNSEQRYVQQLMQQAQTFTRGVGGAEAT